MPPILTRLAALLGDWPVGSPAVAVATAALRDKEWQRQARERLREEAARLRSLLARHGCAVVGGTDLFALVEVGDAGTLHDRLAKAGVWTRAFADHPNWLRLGLPPDDLGFGRLERALRGQ
jgi:cobalamin biosynthetic protein CobC